MTENKDNVENKNEEVKDEIRSELGDLISSNDEKDNTKWLIGILVSLLAIILIHSAYSSYVLLTDVSVPTFGCPKNFNLDSPVLLSKVNAFSKKEKDSLIRSFSIKFIKRLFPRTKKDAQPFYNYIYNHTEGELKRKYLARLRSIEEIGNRIESGSFIKWWFVNPNDEKTFKIRKIDNSTWKISANGVLHKLTSGFLEKTQPSIEFNVYVCGSTKYNIEGLCVDDLKSIYLIDPLSGKSVDVINQEEDDN